MLALPVSYRVHTLQRYAHICHKFCLLSTAKTFKRTPLFLFSDKSFPPHVIVRLPALSPTMTHGTIQSWDVDVGVKIDEGDQMALMETDKATMSLESPESGFVAKILVPAGTKDVPVKEPICVLVDDEADIPAFDGFSAPDQPVAVSEEEPKVDPVVTTESPAQTQSSGGKVLASPMAKRLAKESGIDLRNLTSEKNDGIIRRDDVLGMQQTQSTPPSVTPSVSPDYMDIPLTKIREVISSRLLHSKQTIPHYYLTIDVQMGESLSLRKRLNESSTSKLSINDLIIKASALACMKYPQLNSAFLGGFIRQYSNVDVCVAVDAPDGLVTPVVRGAERLGLASIGQTVKTLAEKAKDRRLTPEEYQGGTFTISNLGMFGIDQFCAIINPPQSSILAVGAVRKAVLGDESTEKGFSVKDVMTVTLSCDHRVVDGAVGARWLAHFKKLVEHPELMLL